MSEQALEEPEPEEEPDETTEEDAEEQPEIEDEEFADVDLDAIAEEVEDESGADSDESDEEASEETESDETESDEADSDDSTPTGTGDSWGDMYVGTLTTLSNAAIDEHGKPGAEKIDESLARQLHLGEYMDEWMAKHGKREDMPPEQALMLSTAMFLTVVVGTKTELPSQLMSEFDF
jgi:hypothetical protein